MVVTLSGIVSEVRPFRGDAKGQILVTEDETTSVLAITLPAASLITVPVPRIASVTPSLLLLYLVTVLPSVSLLTLTLSFGVSSVLMSLEALPEVPVESHPPHRIVSVTASTT